MAITEVVEDYKNRKGEWSEDAASYERSFKVESDDPDELESTIMTAEDPDSAGVYVPVLYSNHPGDTTTYLFKKNIKLQDPSKSRVHWIVSCFYKRKPGGFDGPVENPWDLPAEISVGSARYVRGLDLAYDKRLGPEAVGPPAVTWIRGGGYVRGDPFEAILNINGRPFDPVPQQEEENVLLSIRRNEKEEDFDAAEVVSFRNSVNSVAINIAGFDIGVYEGRFSAITFSEKWTQANEKYYNVDYQIEINPETHVRKLQNRGFEKLKDTATLPSTGFPAPEDTEHIKIAGKPILEPVPLGFDGKMLAAGADMAYMHYLTYFPKAWAPLALPGG